MTFVSTSVAFLLLTTARGCCDLLCVHHEFMAHICPCGLYIVHSCSSTDMAVVWRSAAFDNKFSTSDWKSCDIKKFKFSNPVQQSSPAIQSSNTVQTQPRHNQVWFVFWIQFKVPQSCIHVQKHLHVWLLFDEVLQDLLSKVPPSWATGFLFCDLVTVVVEFAGGLWFSWGIPHWIDFFLKTAHLRLK